MTTQEAIANIDEVLNSTLNYDDTLDYQLTTDDCDWLEIAKSALEKQIPKKQEYDCKNCIHDEVCPVWDDYNDKPCKDGYRGFCYNYNKFKDKSQYIKLPCSVGDKAYKSY